MRTAGEIYTAYSIMPALALHQLRVAAVGKFICDNFLTELDVDAVVQSGLFHDMGNIIKADLTVFPEFSEPEGVAHWQLVKQRAVETYGADEHRATLTIIEELALTSRVPEILKNIGFSKLEQTIENDSYELKIAEYADLRVGPHGVLSLDGRINEGHERYRGRRGFAEHDDGLYEKLCTAARELERQIFERATITPDDICEDLIRPIAEKLRGYRVA